MHNSRTGWLIATLLICTGGCNKPDKPAPLTPQEQERLDLMDHPKIISKELVTSFHRVGSGLVLQTKSGTFEFVVSDYTSGDGRDNCSDIFSPEDEQAFEKSDPSGIGPYRNQEREESKQPIYNQTHHKRLMMAGCTRPSALYGQIINVGAIKHANPYYDVQGGPGDK
jgi:hypothetical protein